MNDLYPDGDRLLVTESFGGAVYEVPIGGGAATTWVQDDLLDTDSFGANGITRIDDDVYVAVTRASGGDDDVGRVVRVPVAADGSAGTPETFPSEVVFDPTAPGKAFVCNFSPGVPGDAGVLRTHP